MSNDFTVKNRQNVDAFDRLTLNADHRLTFEDGTLTAVYPAGADETEYVVALFPVEDGAVELPDGAVVLEATDTVVALTPATAYGGGE
ncbi:hypothetical protein ACFQMA_11980 [Halosimplex aquaticum]|uniref:Uncharacterized protein n=1 Tax=Halosimplex aquaticum TaxID=3026162 RepID=A0ABD5Y2R1_9EURY|nr:hypothetical protein [Halosimplex aquaticum]